MTGYVLRRIGQALIVALIVSFVVFAILHALPGGLIRAQLGTKASTFSVHQLERQEGLLRPFPVQFGVWLLNAIHGNLGYSYKLNQTVGSLLAENMPRTLLLVGTSLVFSVAIAVPMGLWQGMRRSKVDDHSLTVLMLVFYSMPNFLLGVIFIVVFNLWIPVFPSTAADFGTGMLTNVRDLILPILTLCLGNVSYFSRYMRTATIDNLLEDYVRTARAGGASRRRVLVRHVLRNALGSTVTLLGLSLPEVLSGALIVEALFDFPGVGLLFWNASQQRDYPVLLGVVLVVTLATVIGNFFADVTYGVLDPRIRHT